MHSKRMLPHLSIPNPLSSCFPSSKTLTPSPTEMTPITALSRMTCHMQDAGTAGIFLPQHILAQSQLFPQRTTTDHSVSPQGMASASLGSRTMSTHSRSGSSTSLRTPPFIRSRAPSPPSIVECHERGATESLLTDHHLNTPTCWNNESNERISNSGGTGQDAHPLQAHSQRSHAYATQSLLRHLSRSSSLVTSFMDASRKSIENNSLDAPCLSHERSQSSTGTQSCADHQSDATAFGESEYIENRVYISTHTRRKYTCGPASMDTRWPYPFRTGQLAYAKGANGHWRIVTVCNGPHEEYDAELSRYIYAYTCFWTSLEGDNYRATFAPEQGTLKPVGDAHVEGLLLKECVELMPII